MTPSLPDKILAIHARLDEARIAHAFGGAFALAYYGEPRATIDVDLNVFIPPTRYPALRAALDELGTIGDVDAGELEREGQCRLWWGDTPIDLFFAYDALHDAMRRSARSVPFADETLPVLAPEHLIVCKAIFDRPKDWLDIEQILVCVETLDVSQISRWLKRIAGQEDSRTRRFDRLADELLGS